MMLPDSVMKVMPTATQPMNDTVVSKASRLMREKKPGVATAQASKASTATMRTICTVSIRTCRSGLAAGREAGEPPVGVDKCDAMVFSIYAGGWVMSLTTCCIEAWPRS